jgi:hypothetical protein
MLIYASHFKTDQKEQDEHNHHYKAVIQQRRTVESYMLSRPNIAPAAGLVEDGRTQQILRTHGTHQAVNSGALMLLMFLVQMRLSICP